MEGPTDRYDHIRQMYGSDVFEAIHNSRVLVVGAGGIGCEILKNIVVIGFKNIVVLDLDTIDVSNLNRQFLFRKHHVGMPKALVARETVLRFNPDANIEAYHLPIQDSKFSTAYMSTFDVVLSALDNKEARVYLNRLCFAAKVPLIESGTSGYSGQCSPVIHGVTPCFECYQSNSAPKTFAVCTIRNTPELPIHCIAWAKHLFLALFGPQDDSNVLLDLIHGAKEGQGDEIGSTDSTMPTDSTTSTDSNSPTTQTSDITSITSPTEYADLILQKCFVDDIKAQRLVTDRWVNREPPIVQHLQRLYKQGDQDPASKLTRTTRALQVYSPGFYAKEFRDSIIRIKTQRSDEIGSMEFDKDDIDAMIFVAAAANVRMHCYHIPLISEFMAKGIAGNIIHAIATTNAIAAGYSVKSAINLFKYAIQQHITTSQVHEPLPFVGFINNPDNLITFSKDIPNENGTCFCTNPSFTLYIDGNTTTMYDLFMILYKQLQWTDFSIDVLTFDKSFGFMSDYEQFEEILFPEDDDREGEDDKKKEQYVNVFDEKIHLGDRKDTRYDLQKDEKIRNILQCELASKQAGIVDGTLLEIRDYDSTLSIIIRVNYRSSTEMYNMQKYENSEEKHEERQKKDGKEKKKEEKEKEENGNCEKKEEVRFGIFHKKNEHTSNITTMSQSIKSDESAESTESAELVETNLVACRWMLQGNFIILPTLQQNALKEKQKKEEQEEKARQAMEKEREQAKAARIVNDDVALDILDDSDSEEQGGVRGEEEGGKGKSEQSLQSLKRKSDLTTEEDGDHKKAKLQHQDTSIESVVSTHIPSVTTSATTTTTTTTTDADNDVISFSDDDD